MEDNEKIKTEGQNKEQFTVDLDEIISEEEYSINEEKPKISKKQIEKIFENENKFKRKTILLIGTVILLVLIFFIGYYVFFKKLDLQTNVSTDKKIGFVNINGNKEQITTQKYVSNFKYSMRYDIKKFKVFNYRNQDIFKGIENESVLVVVEKATLPTVCLNNDNKLKSTYNQCEIVVDINTTEQYVYRDNATYKITIKLPLVTSDSNHYDERIDLMIKSFKMEI